MNYDNVLFSMEKQTDWNGYDTGGKEGFTKTWLPGLEISYSTISRPGPIF